MLTKILPSPSLLRGFLFIVSLIGPTTSALAESRGWFSVQTDNYSDAIPIDDLRFDRPSSHRKGDHLYSFTQWQVGIHPKKWLAFGYKQRLDLYANHSSDTALIYYASAQKKDVEERDYTYQLDGYVQRTKGVFAYISLDWEAFSTRFTLECGETTGLTKVDIDGDLTYDNDQINGTALLDYYYERDVLYDRKVTPASGQYYSLSFEGTYRSDFGLHKVDIQDWINETVWKDAPYTAVSMNTDRVADRDDDGHITIRPLGSGIETYEDLSVSLPTRINFYNELNFDADYSPILGSRFFNGRYYPYLGSKLGTGVGVTYQIRTRSVGLKYDASKIVQYQIEMDTLQYKDAHRINLALKVNW